MKQNLHSDSSVCACGLLHEWLKLQVPSISNNFNLVKKTLTCKSKKMSPLKTEVLLCHLNCRFSSLVSFLSILAQHLLSTPIFRHIVFPTLPHLSYFSPPHHLRTPMSSPIISKSLHNLNYCNNEIMILCFWKGMWSYFISIHNCSLWWYNLQHNRMLPCNKKLCHTVNRS